MLFNERSFVVNYFSARIRGRDPVNSDETITLKTLITSIR